MEDVCRLMQRMDVCIRREEGREREAGGERGGIEGGREGGRGSGQWIVDKLTFQIRSTLTSPSLSGSTSSMKVDHTSWIMDQGNHMHEVPSFV
jgi:hypothetical protein